MALKITEILKQNGLDAKGKPGDNGQQQQQQQQQQQESPAEKEAREKKEKELQMQQQQESPAEKEAREKKEKELQQQQQQQESPAEKEAREKKEKELQQQQQQQSQGEIDDATLIAALQKRGKKVTSLDEIDKPAPVQLTAEEEQQAAQQRQDNIRTFALKNKKVTSTDFDNYVRDTAIPMKDLAFNLFKTERLQELKDKKVPADQIPNDEALLTEFNETHFQYAAEDDPKRVRSEKLLKKTVDEYIETKYANILDLEEEYDNDQQTTVQRGNYEKVINEVVTGLGEEMEFEIVVDKDKDEKFPFKFKITPEVSKAITQSYLSDTSFNLFGKGSVNKELLQQAVKGNIIQREFSKILSEGALAYASTKLDEAAKGRRGIPPSRKEEGSEGGEKRVNKVVKSLLDNAENKKVLQTS